MTWQVASEIAKRYGKTKSQRMAVATSALFFSGLAGAATLPSGGNVVAGSGSISQSGQVMTINQGSSKMAIDWQSFSVGSGNTVNFVQPNAASVALNRVLGSDVSVIQGAINANGQVFLLNPNGVLFTPGAQVNVGSLLASTLSMSNADFMNGNYKLEGASSNAVVNQGNITALGNSSKTSGIALIAAHVINDGSLVADQGSVLLAAAGSVTLDLGGPVKLQVQQGALNALLENGGAIRADGGMIYLTAKAVNELTTATINSNGVIRAQTLASGEKGDIRLIADMQSGVLNVGGTLDASAPGGGDGGFIETSGASVNMADNLTVTTLAPHGQTGELLIDPNDYTVAASGGNATGASFTSLINSNNVTISTATHGTTGGNGDIFINDNITKTAGSGTTSLTFLAERNIAVNSNITSTAGALDITLSAANNSAGSLGGVRIATGKTLNSNGGKILIGGAGGNVAGAQTAHHGIGYALNYSASQEAISIGSSANILSGGGDITINGYATQPGGGSSDTTGVHIGASAVIDSGHYAPNSTVAAYGGYINIAGKYVGGVGGNTDKVFGVKIDNPSGGAGQTTISASTTTGSIRIEGSSSYDTAGSYALNMATNGLAGNIYFNAYSVADLIFILNGGLKGVTFTYSPPTSGCRTGYPNCGMLAVNASANNSYLYATYNAVNMSTLPIYVSSTLSGSKVYDGTLVASNLNFSNTTVFDPNASGYTSSNVTSASYVTPSANVGSYLNLSADSLSRNYSAGGKNYVVGYNFTVSPAYSITPATATLSAVKTYDGASTFSAGQIAVSGVHGESLTLVGSGPASAISADVLDNSTNYLQSLGGLTLADGTGLASNYVLPSLANRSSNNTATINPFGITVLGVGGSRNYNGTTLFTASQLNLDSGITGVTLNGDAEVASANAGTYTAWTTSNLSLTGSSAANYTLAGGSVSAVITPAPLGLAVNATYNGTTGFNSASGIGNAVSGTLTSGGSLFATGLIGSEKITGITVSDANVDAISANKFVTAVTGSDGFVASNYALYGAGTPAYHSSVSNGVISSSNNTVAITPAPLGIAATPVYNTTTSFTATTSVADGATESLTTGGNVTVAGLVNGQRLSGFSIDNANVADASKVIAVSLANGIDARNYVLNGYVLNSGATVTAGSAANGTAATNFATLSAAPLGIAVTGTYSGSTSIVPTAFSTNGLLGSDTITGLSAVTLNNANVVANGSNYVTAMTLSGGTANLANYRLTPAYQPTLDGSGNAASNTTNVATLNRVLLGVGGSRNYNGTRLFTANQLSLGSGVVSNDDVSLSGDAEVASANAGTYTSWTTSNLSLTGSSAANYTLSGGSVSAVITPAPLGLAVNATYNGTTGFNSASGIGNAVSGTLTSGGSLFATGLIGSEKITGITVSDANVDAITANKFVTAVTGSDGFVASNYALYGAGSPAYHSSVSNGVISSSNNTVAITPAPLGIAATPVYNTTTSFTATTSVADGVTESLTTGGNVTVAGLVNGQRLSGFSIDNANVADASKVIAVSLANGIDARNYVLNGYVLNSGATVTAGSAANGTAATNFATLSAAPLGIAVTGTYSGSTSIVPTAFSTNGLLGSDTITGLSAVTLNNANVVANGSNFVTAMTLSSGTANLANYRLTPAYQATLDGNGNAASNTTNVATLNRAPLGVTVSGNYNGTAVLSTATGASIIGYGLQGQDAGVNLLTATLNSKDVATANKVLALTGSGSFDQRNYVLDSNWNPAAATAGNTLDGLQATNTASLTARAITITADNKRKLLSEADPALTYNISNGSLIDGDSLAGTLTRAPGTSLGKYAIHAGLSNSNYAITALDGVLEIVAPNEPSPPPPPTIVPAFIDNGVSALAAEIKPTDFGGLNYVPLGGTDLSLGGNTPATNSSLNFVGTNLLAQAAPSNSVPAAANPGEQTASSSDSTIDDTRGRQLTDEALSSTTNDSRSTLNFVAGETGDEQAGTAEGNERKAAQELNINNVTVPSASGPLDVFVVNSGINLGRKAKSDPASN